VGHHPEIALLAEEGHVAEKFEDKRINDALELLNELAKEKKAELRGMISEKYKNLSSALGGSAEELGNQARAAFAEGEAKAREFASQIDENVHKNPWPYLGGTALGFLILGMFLARPKK
jgi:ElaB/YqjD/DUF883 family membrane-anchored ribosome-binding protein